MSSTISASPFSEVRVIHTYRGNTVVYWKSDRTDLYFGGATIEWSRTGVGSWHEVDGAVVLSDGQIMDPKRRMWGKDLDLFYRVRVDLGTGRSAYSHPMQIGYDYAKETWLKFKEMLRLAELTYKLNPLALNVCLLKRRIHGPRCRKCRDRGTEQKVLNTCHVCYGTQVVGGYYPAYHMRLLEGQKKRTYKGYDEVAPMDLDSRREAHVVAYPVQIDERDVIVNPSTGERFQVAALKTSGITNEVQAGNLVIVQKFDMDVLPSDHVTYDFPLDGCGVLGQADIETDPCDPVVEEDPCELGEEEQPVLPDVPIVPEPCPNPEKDGAELVWPDA